VAEAAALLNVSRATVYRLVAEGKVRAIRVSNAIRIQRDDLLAGALSAAEVGLEQGGEKPLAGSDIP
jgi:excisionase family DNA binding protein